MRSRLLRRGFCFDEAKRRDLRANQEINPSSSVYSATIRLGVCSAVLWRAKNVEQVIGAGAATARRAATIAAASVRRGFRGVPSGATVKCSHSGR